MDLTPGGSCSGVRQLEQFTSRGGGWNIVSGGFVNWKGDQFTLKASSKKGFELGIQIGDRER